jgi:glycosyltransferase involved in cell wall biosynthesis
LRRVLAVPLPGLSGGLILVDDGSSDGTRELLANLPALKEKPYP